ncbi:hypothetical protein HWQ46_19260 [Shewanella sp. D64]|uniref:hypothetical protein n=1 Tax=unclassified Shewanella TaxID=196818 RepID=UPI0022BA70A1|nr:MULTISPECIES: hypothetical protein [unclassified Shewanella]MEC4727688.1 hypothetical protein [Shewanella sp. D64]MEC4739739.1 hypothetical protein [Shewanella sp. E94]WBJ94084.1 hypothetical protein HWQ47_19575 [Shewanella sp. MTB7]
MNGLIKPQTNHTRTHLLSLLIAINLCIANVNATSLELPNEEELGYLCYADGYEQKISVEMASWLARMIDGETYGHPSITEANTMLWAVAQLSAVRKTKPKLVWKLTELVQLYSQPINHKWTKTGHKCKRYYAKDFKGQIPNNCSKKKVTRREKNRIKPWSELAPVAQQAVLHFAKGSSTNSAIGVQGWYASGLWNRRDRKNINTREHKLYHSRIDNNVFYTRTKNPATNRWDGFEITVVGADSFCPMIINLSSNNDPDSLTNNSERR